MYRFNVFSVFYVMNRKICLNAEYYYLPKHYSKNTFMHVSVPHFITRRGRDRISALGSCFLPSPFLFPDLLSPPLFPLCFLFFSLSFPPSLLLILILISSSSSFSVPFLPPALGCQRGVPGLPCAHTSHWWGYTEVASRRMLDLHWWYIIYIFFSIDYMFQFLSFYFLLLGLLTALKRDVFRFPTINVCLIYYNSFSFIWLASLLIGAFIQVNIFHVSFSIWLSFLSS